mgnify:FL=1
MDLISKNIHWILRISLASTFIIHGYPKLGSSVANLGFIGYLVGPFELIGAVLLILGPFTNEILTKVGSAMIGVIMIGAIYMHLIVWNDSFNDVEWQGLIIAVCLLFIFKGDEV